MLKNNVFINKQLTNEAHLNSFLDFINLSVGCDCHNKFKKKNQHQESDFFHYLKDSEKFDTNRFNDWIQKKLANNLIIAFDSFLKNNLDLKTLFEILFGEEDKKEISDHFEKHIRYCLETVIMYQNSVWVSHGCESLKLNVDYFPEHHWTIKNKNDLTHYDDLISVNVGHLPFDNCLKEHLPGPKNNSPTNSFQNNIIGIIPKEKVLNFEWEIVPSPKESFGRNHLFIQKNNNPMPIKNWIFLYTTQESFNLINTQEIGRAHV